MEIKKDSKPIDRYTGANSMFCFVFPGCPEIKNKALQEELKIAKYYLEGYWTLVTRKLLENNTADDLDFTTNSIMNVVEKLPLLSGFSSKQESRRNVKDIYLLARDFLNITIDNLDPTEKCLKKTIGYLMNIGSQIGIANHNKHGYELNILSASIEHNAHSLQVKFKVSKAILDNLQKCGYESDMKKGRRVRFDYQVQSFEALLNLQSLQQPKIKAGLDRLFKPKDLSPIHNSRNYYNP